MMGDAFRRRGFGLILFGCALGAVTGWSAEETWSASLQLIQTGFLDSTCGHPDACEGPCNVLLLAWNEDAQGPASRPAARGYSISIRCAKVLPSVTVSRSKPSRWSRSKKV